MIIYFDITSHSHKANNECDPMNLKFNFRNINFNGLYEYLKENKVQNY